MGMWSSSSPARWRTGSIPAPIGGGSAGAARRTRQSILPGVPRIAIMFPMPPTIYRRPRDSAPSVRLPEEPAQFGDQILRVVALHGVAGARPGDEFSVRQTLRQADAVLLVKHVAVAAAHDQGRALDAAQPVGERGPLGAMLFLVKHLKAPAIVF